MSLKGWVCVMVGAAIVAGPVSLLGQSASFYRLRLDDKKAVYLTRNEGGLHGDGLGDDTDAIQGAINKVEETTGQGIVFVPEGRYRISKTLFLWPGVRLIGWGAHRPAFVLGKHTPGYQQGMGYMLMFTGNRPRDNGAPVRQGRPQK